jgi:hypothetical protein
MTQGSIPEFRLWRDLQGGVSWQVIKPARTSRGAIRAALHQHITHKSYYRDQKQFSDAILAFMREAMPPGLEKFPRQDLR